MFDDGSDANADVLIGADGIHSVVRKLIDPAGPAPTYGGLMNLGGYSRGVRVDGECGSYTMIFGRRAFFGYVLAPADEVWWFANVPRRDEPVRGEVETVTAEAWRERLTALYADDAGPAVQLVRASDPADSMRASPIHSIPHLPVWHTSRMIAIGDAAHAPTPTSGQGASLAIEDAVVLAKCLRDLADPQRAFAHFEALRRPRVERVIKQAARVNSNKAAGPVARTLRDAILPVVLRMVTNSNQLSELYAHHIDWGKPIDPVTA